MRFTDQLVKGSGAHVTECCLALFRLDNYRLEVRVRGCVARTPHMVRIQSKLVAQIESKYIV